MATLAATGAWAADGAVKVEQAWARPTVAGQSSGGGYVTLTSREGDRLLGGSTSAAERVELHMMKMEGDVMRMRQVESIELPPGQTVKLEPGGLHLMFVGLKAPLKAGVTMPLVLRFAKAGEVKVEVPISTTAPKAP
jgi:copper(I)-binding protein